GGVGIERRGEHLMVDGKGCDSGFEPAGTAKQVTGHRFGRAGRKRIRVVSECALDGDCLNAVAGRRRRPVNIDVVDPGWGDCGVVDCLQHDAPCALSILRWRGYVERVACHSVADNFSVELRTPLAGMLELLENQNACALTDDETITILVEWPRGSSRIIVSRRECTHRGESTDRHRSDCTLASTADHGNRITTLDDSEAVSDRMGSRAAGCGSSRIRSLGAR